MKQFHTMKNIGKAKYVINSHDGEKTHTDGSPFFDIAIYRNKKKFEAACKSLLAIGYQEV